MLVGVSEVLARQCWGVLRWSQGFRLVQQPFCDGICVGEVLCGDVRQGSTRPCVETLSGGHVRGGAGDGSSDLG